jgi:hypothetical protein
VSCCERAGAWRREKPRASPSRSTTRGTRSSRRSWPPACRFPKSLHTADTQLESSPRSRRATAGCARRRHSRLPARDQTGTRARARSNRRAPRGAAGGSATAAYGARVVTVGGAFKCQRLCSSRGRPYWTLRLVYGAPTPHSASRSVRAGRGASTPADRGGRHRDDPDRALRVISPEALALGPRCMVGSRKRGGCCRACTRR